ncbi:MAG TPA: CRISPR-associated endonuclease Cas1 [Dissulfurispiraceae bacterium]|nr:CRISPR-associated endonuclease Cas1 [Dissulfurispiraceae bacterium]
MGTLYIDRKGLHIKLDGNALAFYANGEREGSAPILPLKRVVVVGGVTIETPALHRLADENVSVLFLSGKRARFTGRLSGSLHNNGELRRTQYRRSLEPFAMETATAFVRHKILAQLDLLREALDRRADLRKPLFDASAVLASIAERLETVPDSSASLLGLEGGASASYFGAYTTLFPPSLEFTRRVRRPPTDPVNALLSLCYTLVHYEAVREIETIGLDPTIGFLHEFSYGRESLACDLVEGFRPSVDRFVWEQFRERTLTARDFSREEGGPGCYLTKEGRKKFYPMHEEHMKQVRPALTRDVRELARRIQDE